MCRNSTILFLAAAALLLAKGDREVGLRVEVRTSNSAIEIIGADVEQVTSDDPSRATVRMIDGRVVVGAVEPDSGPLRVRVPRRCSLDVMTSNAAIRVSGVTGPMRLNTSNGPIEIGLAGELNANLSAHTSNAHIHSEVEVSSMRAGENFLEGKIGSGGAEWQLQTSNAPIYLRVVSVQEHVDSTFTADTVK